MNTPSINTIASMTSEWIGKHKALLTIIWLLCIAGVNQFVMADDFLKFKIETETALVENYKKDQVQDALIELAQIREDIDDYQRFPDYKGQDHIMERLERLRRREAVLEKKVEVYQ